MAAIVYQKNKKSGVVYAYESVSYWSKEKKQSRARRKCIGRVDPETKEIVPTRKRKRQPVTGKAKPGPIPINVPGRKFYGATYLLDRIGEVIGVIDNLKTCFPDNYRQILSIVYYLIMEDKNPSVAFPTGQQSIGILTVMSYHPKEAASCLPQLPRKPNNVFSDFRENAGLRKNFLHTITHQYPVTHNVSGKSVMVKTKTMSTCHRSIWPCCSASNPAFPSTTENWQATFLTLKH